MAFKEDNYWNRTAVANKPLRPQALVGKPPQGADYAAIIQALNNPLPEEITAADRAGIQQRYGGIEALKQHVFQNSVPDTPLNHLLTTNPDTTFTPNPDKVRSFVSDAPALGSAFKDGGPLSGAVGDAKSAVDGIGSLVAGMANDAEAAAANTPEAIYKRLREQAGAYGYSGPSPDEMVAKEFDPQFALLDQLGKQQTARYDHNKADITGMYQGLVNQAGTTRNEDQARYQQASDTVGQGYKQATDNLTGSATAYQTAMAKELARLGVNEGTGDVVAGVGKNLQDNVARLNTQGANTKDLMAGLGASQYAYDTNNIGITKQAGLNTQEQFLNDYMSKMDQNDNQRLQLTGQRGQAENNYGMQIQDLLQKGRSGFESSLNDQYKAIMAGNQQGVDNQFKQAGLDLQLGQFDFQKQQAAAKQQQGASNPYDTLSQRALETYKDPQKARQVVDEIMNQYQKNPGAATVGDFFKGLDQGALQSDPNMTALIYDFVSKVLPKK